MSRKPYATDLSDLEWLILEPLLLTVLKLSNRGRPRQVDLREIVNAIRYVLRTGCAWRLLPHDFPAWQTVYGYFRRWRDSGVWEQLNDALREAVRLEAGEPQSQVRPLLIVRVSRPVRWRGNGVLMAPNW